MCSPYHRKEKTAHERAERRNPRKNARNARQTKQSQKKNNPQKNNSGKKDIYIHSRSYLEILVAGVALAKKTAHERAEWRYAGACGILS